MMKGEADVGFGTGWRILFPPAQWLRAYDLKWLQSDAVAGLTAAAVVIPQAMAYAAIAGLPLVAGLYTALVPLTVYALSGTSRPLSVTTTSTIAILTANALNQLPSAGSSAQLLPAAATLTFLVGGILLVASILRFGMVANFISEPVLTGFKGGVGMVIIVDQLPKMLGIRFPQAHLFLNLLSTATHLPQASVPTISLALPTLVLLVGLQRFLPRLPASLVAVASGIAASSIFALQSRGIQLVGEVRGGLPPFALPNSALFEFLWPAAAGIALMSFVETVAAGQAFRTPDEPRPQANRELLALGLTNLAGGFFCNMPSGGGTSQTAVNRRAGARTQISGLVAAVAVVAVLFLLAPLVRLIPQATLAAVVVVSCAGMIHVQEFRAILRTRLMEFWWAITALAGVMILGTLKGIVVAVLLSLLALIYHANRRPIFVMARKAGTDIFRPRSLEHPEDEVFPGLLLLKTEGIIHFGNAQRIGNAMWRLIQEHEPRVVALDCSAIPDFEYTALKMLADAEKKLEQSGIAMWLVALNPEPLRLIQKAELGKTLGRDRMIFNLDQTVKKFQAQSSSLQPETAKARAA